MKLKDQTFLNRRYSLNTQETLLNNIVHSESQLSQLVIHPDSPRTIYLFPQKGLTGAFCSSPGNRSFYDQANFAEIEINDCTRVLHQLNTSLDEGMG